MRTGETTPGAWRVRPATGSNRKRGLLVAYQGERGSNGDQAIDLHWGTTVERKGYRGFAGVIDAVVRGETDAAVLPVHNAVIGEIPGIGAMLGTAPVRVVDHVEVDVMHCLLGVPGATLSQVVIARSHPAALAQCARFFMNHPGIAARMDYDTAGAARRVARKRIPSHAAIAPAGCAGRYGLEVLAEGIADLVANRTRFAVVERASVEQRGGRA